MKRIFGEIKMSWKDILKEETAFGKPLSYWKNLHKKSKKYGMSFNEYMMFVIAPKYKKENER